VSGRRGRASRPAAPRDDRRGGVIHTYLGYDPARFPPPSARPPDLVSGAFDHLLAFGSMRELTEEELLRAVRLDPSQVQGLGPSLEGLIALLEERKRKILATWEMKTVRTRAREAFDRAADDLHPPRELEDRYRREVTGEQLRGLEGLWYQAERLEPGGDFAAKLPGLIERLEAIYELDECASKYDFTGRQVPTVEQGLAIKAELEEIDRLLEQLREAMRNARIAIIDLEALSEFAPPEDVENLGRLREQVEEMLREAARRQGIEQNEDGTYRLQPKALRIFQGRLLESIFGELDAARSGRHRGPVTGEGPVELPRTRGYEFGDSAAHLDLPGTMINAMIRRAGERAAGIEAAADEPVFKGDDIQVHETRNNPKCATTVIMDMSGSMRQGGLYVGCKRMALALDGLIRTEYPGDFLRFVEMYSFAKLRPTSEIVELMPKPVTIRHPVVQLRADMSDPDITESQIPPHFTNIQHALRLSRTMLAAQDTPNRQIVLITDGLPTAHFEGEQLYLLYPPHPRTEEATMREASACAREGITINIFLLPTWAQTSEDVQFAQRMAETTKGRVFFTGGGDLDRFVLWDYVARRRSIIG